MIAHKLEPSHDYDCGVWLFGARRRLIGGAAHHLWCGCEARCCTRGYKRARAATAATHSRPATELSTTLRRINAHRYTSFSLFSGFFATNGFCCVKYHCVRVSLRTLNGLKFFLCKRFQFLELK